MDLDATNDPQRCREPGCLTRLSMYNTGQRCFRHADEAVRARFERSSAYLRTNPFEVRVERAQPDGRSAGERSDTAR